MYTINGSKFKSIKGFYRIVEQVFTLGLSWKIGRNLNAFNDILSGGFGRHDCGEMITVQWINFKKSEERLNSRFLVVAVRILEESENIDFQKFDFQSST